MYHAVGAGIAALGVLAPSVAGAHSAGVSQSTFTLAPNGRVTAVLELAQSDADKLFAGAEDAGAVGDDLVTTEIDVRADGKVCPGRFEGARHVGGDGTEIRASFACWAPVGTLTVALPLLDALGGDPAHAIHLAAEGASTDAALHSGAQVATLVIRPAAPVHRFRGLLRILTLVGLAALFALRMRRRLAR